MRYNAISTGNSHIYLWAKMALFWEVFSGKCFVCCALTVLYSTYSTVGWSEASAVYYTAHQHTSYTYTPECLYLQRCNQVQ